MAKRLTWRKEPDEQGRLARVCQGERGYDLRCDGRKIGHVRPVSHGYYWFACDDNLGIPLRNTCCTPVPDIETAKADCMAYVKGCMARKEG